MPYSKKAKYTHHRRAPPKEFKKGTLRTVPVSHVKTKKKYPEGTKAIRGERKKTGRWGTQSILVPKKGRKS